MAAEVAVVVGGGEGGRRWGGVVVVVVCVCERRRGRERRRREEGRWERVCAVVVGGKGEGEEERREGEGVCEGREGGKEGGGVGGADMIITMSVTDDAGRLCGPVYKASKTNSPPVALPPHAVSVPKFQLCLSSSKKELVRVQRHRITPPFVLHPNAATREHTSNVAPKS